MYQGTDHKLASVIVPIYKVEKYIKRCIDSVLCQSYTNLEVILVDDGSPDCCGKICDEYAQMDSRISVIHKENGGLSDARNVGIEAAKGEYLFFVDSDDWVDVDFCESAIHDLESHHADVVVYGYRKVDEDDTLLEVCGSLHSFALETQEGMRKLIDNTIENYAWNKVYKKKLFDDVRYPVARLWEDIGTTYLVFHQAQIIYVSNRITYNYLIRTSSITGMKSLKSHVDIFEQRYARYKFLQKAYPQITAVAIDDLARFALRGCIYLGNAKQYAKTLRQMQQFLREYQKEILESNSSIKCRAYYMAPTLFVKACAMVDVHPLLAKKVRSMGILAQKVVRRIRRIVRKFRNKRSVQTLWSPQYDRRCYIIGTPDHNNLGDHAIALASIQYLTEMLPQHQIIDITENEYWQYARSLARKLSKRDLVILQGGGNVGNQYMYIERIRRDIIRLCKSPILMFPQTIFFTPDNQGCNEQIVTSRLYNKTNNMVICAREKYSYALMQKAFPDRQILEVPDIVLRYRIPSWNFSREGVLLCLRSDKETNITFQDQNSIKQNVLQVDADVSFTDTCLRRTIDRAERETKLIEKLQQIASARLVITDRLHCMLFAALTGTPCIVLSNYNYKVKGVYQWIQQLEYIVYLENLEAFPKTVDQLYHASITQSYRYSRLDEAFEVLDHLLKVYANAQ